MEFDRYSPQPEPPREPPAARTWWPWALALLVVAVGVGAYLLFSSKPAPPPPPAAPPSLPPADEPAAAEAPAAVELPPLAESDDWLRRVVAELSANPDLARWLVSDNLVRRFTAAVDNVARGESPRPHLGFLDPAGGFDVVERGGELYPAARSYARYDRISAVVDSIDAAGAAEFYRQLRPLLQQGYADLGYPDRDFDDVLADAIKHLLATPLPSGQPSLAPGVESYAFRDPRLEGLTPAQKHLLRAGPDNAAVILDKLREFARALDLDVG